MSGWLRYSVSWYCMLEEKFLAHRNFPFADYSDKHTQRDYRGLRMNPVSDGGVRMKRMMMGCLAG